MKVKPGLFSASDEVTDDYVDSFDRKVRSYSRIEAGFSPTMPIPGANIAAKMSVAADNSRDENQPMTLSYTRVCPKSRYTLNAPTSYFEEKLLELRRKEDPLNNEWCIDFIKEKRITHYITSITLGAMKYTVEGQEGVNPIGVFSRDGRTPREGMEEVIFYEYRPLTNLVADPDLKKCLEDAIRRYLAGSK